MLVGDAYVDSREVLTKLSPWDQEDLSLSHSNSQRALLLSLLTKRRLANNVESYKLVRPQRVKVDGRIVSTFPACTTSKIVSQSPKQKRNKKYINLCTV